LAMADDRNAFGLNYARVVDEGRCSFCLNCARMCPDLAIVVYRTDIMEAQDA
jgi:formate hydrogenlyase subunit 6/NADH:ubiquinone oxidoreductase subunit I